MKILFCTRGPLTKGLGAVKVVLEVAESLSALGVECTVKGRDEILPPGTPHDQFPNALRSYLREHSDQFDVIEYEHEDLPFSRLEFEPNALMVARTVLLIHHMSSIVIPHRPGVKYLMRRMIYGARDRKGIEQRIQKASLTIENADLVNVSNRHDRAELLRRGVPAEKIVVLPLGVSKARRESFNKISEQIPPGDPIVAFVGTFDYRKGAREIPAIWDLVRARVPNAKLRLLGTAGLMQTEEEVRACFSRAANSSIEVHPRFDPNMLPMLLGECSVGMFPSWLEGFGFGVLEMLLAAIPVVAYNAPGPPEMLGPEDLVKPGDIHAVADRLTHWLTQPEELQRARTAARLRSLDFNWDTIGRDTLQAYERALQVHRASAGAR